jgi:hypothetical protein
MFLRLLKLAGLDVKATIAELKADLFRKIEWASQQATRKARTLALVAGLFLFAAILALLLLIVGLVALYKWGELQYGPFIGLALDAGALAILAGASALAALWIARSTKSEGSTDAATSPARLTYQAAEPKSQATNTERLAASMYQTPPPKAEDLIEPLFVLLDRYLRWPVTGRPAIDRVLNELGARAQPTTNEAVERAAELVRSGDRATMLSVLGAATVFGWLLVRTGNHRPR